MNPDYAQVAMCYMHVKEALRAISQTRHRDSLMMEALQTLEALEGKLYHYPDRRKDDE